MRIGELSRRSGIPVATIKYYLREGLVPPGEATAPNQADYDERHLVRLELIVALREGAGLSIATLARVLAVMDDHRRHQRPEYLTLAIAALSPPLEVPDDEAEQYRAATDQVDALLQELGWDVEATSPGRDDLVRALVAVHRHLPGLADDAASLRPHAEAVRALADVEVPEGYDPDVDPQAVLRYSVLGTVLFEPVLLALRKLAHVDRIRHLRRARPAGPTAPGGPARRRSR